MSLHTGPDSWGKTGIRLVRVSRGADSSTVPTEQSSADDFYSIEDLTVDTLLEGDTNDVYANGDNAKVLSTDAQKNTVYAFARLEPDAPIEVLAAHLAEHFITSQDPVARASVTIRQDNWDRVRVGGRPAPHSFAGGSTAIRTARAVAESSGTRLAAGIEGLRLFNATGSEFTGFPRDPYTTGTDVSDRALVTELTAHWLVEPAVEPDRQLFDDMWTRVRDTLIEVFAAVYSKSIQFSMRAMATEVLDAFPLISEIAMSVPNIHHNPADLTPFGIDNDRRILIPAERPYSLIRATFSRR